MTHRRTISAPILPSRLMLRPIHERQQRSRAFLIGLITMAALARVARVDAQIYEWVDDTNDRHYVSSLDSVPEAARAKARLLVREATPREDSEVSKSNGGDVDSGVDRPRAGDRFESGWDLGFRTGWEAGHRAGVDEQPVCPAQAPEVVFQSSPPVLVNVPLYDPSGLYYRSPYQGTLTVPFDGGRSRGLTMRQLEEQWGGP